MNIFVTDPDPWKCARVLPDKHIVKMPLETCQMLAIVASEKWGRGFGTLPRLDGTPYSTEKGAFRNHPCTIWAGDFVLNWHWLIQHGLACVMSILSAIRRFTVASKQLCMPSPSSLMLTLLVGLVRNLHHLLVLCL